MSALATNVRKIALKQREQVADGTMAFLFDKPADFTFKPGQAIDLVFADSLFRSAALLKPVLKSAPVAMRSEFVNH